MKKTFESTAENKNNDQPRNVAVFSASAMGKNPMYKEDARLLGEQLAANGDTLLYGGGDKGLMGVVSRATLEAGGQIKGYIIEAFASASEYPQKQFEIQSTDMADRKRQMLQDADAYIALAGGFGTLDEVLEAGNEQYLGAYMPAPVALKPIILINRNGFYDGLAQQLDKQIEEGFVKQSVKDKLIWVKDANEALEALNSFKNGGLYPSQKNYKGPKCNP